VTAGKSIASTLKRAALLALVPLAIAGAALAYLRFEKAAPHKIVIYNDGSRPLVVAINETKLEVAPGASHVFETRTAGAYKITSAAFTGAISLEGVNFISGKTREFLVAPGAEGKLMVDSMRYGNGTERGPRTVINTPLTELTDHNVGSFVVDEKFPESLKTKGRITRIVKLCHVSASGTSQGGCDR